jgi:DNA repair exonuclease SbcCD ATPase subunit
MDKFEKWLEVINEELNPTPTVTEPTISSDINVETGNRTEMISDIDQIMTSLETLAGELTEELSLNEDSLDVAGAAALGGIAALGVGAKRAYDWKVVAPKARKAQAKVNAMAVKIAGVKSAITSAENGEKKDAMKAKLDVAKETMDGLQKSVDDKYGSKSSVVKNALSMEKKAGKMEVLKIALGEASPKQKKEIKDQISKLQKAVVADQKAFKEEKPDEKDTENLQKAVDAEGDKKKKLGDNSNDDKRKAFDDQIESLTKKIKSAEEKLEAGEVDGKKIPDSAKEGIKKNIDALKAKIEKFKDKKSELGESFDTVMLDMKALEEQIDTLISEMFTNINEENKEKSQKESLIYRALKIGNDLLAEEIAGKSSWQLHNTKLYTKYNSIITKLESDQMVSEGLSIRDKFSKLI